MCFDEVWRTTSGDFNVWYQAVQLYRKPIKTDKINYFENELVPSQFFGLNDYLKTQ